MNKTKLIKILNNLKKESQECYRKNNPGKHTQENYTGVQYVQMNTDLLEYFLECQEDEDSYKCWDSLSVKEKREVWEASHFHYGTENYEERDDINFWWSKQKD